MIKSSKQSFLLFAGLAFVIFSSFILGTQAHDMGGMGMSTDEYWQYIMGSPFKATGKTRTYYIAAVEVDWDYAPLKYDVVMGTDFTEDGKSFVESTATHIGSTYRKCLYKEFTSSSFTTMKQRAKEDEYLGFIGPIIHAEVGDTVKIYFKNKCTIPVSIHPHGMLISKSNEGARYDDGTSGSKKDDDIVQPGGSYTYTWQISERCGPGPMDGTSVMFSYHSHVNEDSDLFAGLYGAIIVTRKGMARADGTPKDVDREIIYLFSITDENVSPYLQYNWENFPTPKPAVGSTPGAGDATFGPSNQMHGMNGYLYGNGPVAKMKVESHVRWYFVSVGRAFDAHTPHVHGNDFVVDGMRMDVTSMLAWEIVIADMVPDNVGIWLYHCHVNNHIPDGMITRYEVTKC